MRCPRCGHEMTLDSHRKYGLMMCYDCGYMEGRNMGEDTIPGETNFSRLKKLNLNETAALLAGGLGLDAEQLAEWLEHTAD